MNGIKRRESVGPASYGEVRGVIRNDLVRALAHALPLGTLRLGCQIVSVKLDETMSFPIVHVKNGKDIKAKVRLVTVDISFRLFSMDELMIEQWKYISI